MKKKYTIHQSSETGHVYNERGDNQHITINYVDGWGDDNDEDEYEWENDQDWDDDDDDDDEDDQDIIAPIGKNNKVFINGRRVK